MNEDSLDLKYSDARVPSLGQCLQVAKGIFWARMPLPFSLDHINVWIVEDKDSWVIVDTGLATQKTIAAWEAIHNSFYDGRPLSKVIVTHMHPDHVGLAGWLVRRSGAELWMSREEFLYCNHLLNYTHEEPPQGGIDFYRRAGFDEQQVDHYRASFGGFGQAVRALPHSFRRVKQGDKFKLGQRNFKAIVGSGHSPEHLSLYSNDDKILISGDQLLPTISSNISVWPTEPHSNPMEEWLSSLRALKQQIAPDTLVLPSHGQPFRNAHGRIDQLISGHEQDLDALADFCQTPKRAVDAFEILFKAKIDNSNLIMATGEAIAHFHCLVERGILTQQITEGVAYYQTN